MDKETAWNEVIARLGTIAGIKKVYEGYVDLNSVPHSHYPCVIAEPIFSETDEDSWDMGTSYGNEIFWIDLYILFKIYQKGKQVTGTGALNGALDMEKSVREKLCEAPIHLNGKVVRVLFGRTNYLRTSPEQPKPEQLRVVHLEVGLRMIVCT